MQTTATTTSAQPTARFMGATIREATRNYLEAMDRGNPPALEEIGRDILKATSAACRLHNALAGEEDRWPVPRVLYHAQIADILIARCHVVNVSLAGGDDDLTAIYQESGELKGTYSVSETVFRRLFRSLDSGISKKRMREAMEVLRIRAPRVEICTDIDLVPVGNGIFDYKSKKLLPFSPDKVFLHKCPVDYIPSAVNPVIHNPADGTDFDVESWMDSLSDDKKVVDLLWQVAGAVIRPGVRWDRAALLYSEQGSTGRGSICRLLENLCGRKNCTNIQMKDFDKRFALEPLVGASAVITDGNGAGWLTGRTANLKAVVTGEPILIDRRYKKPLFYRFRGFMVQCVDELPKAGDRANSLYRRLLIIPLTKCFAGAERRYIKDDYLGRKEVLEYVLWKVLGMDYYRLDEPDACKALMAK